MDAPNLTARPVRNDDEMVRALALAEQLMAPHDGETQPSPATGTGPLAQMAKSVRYWLWRAGGRKLVSPEMAQVAENYEREIERLAVAQHAAGERALVQERRRVQELEKQIAQMRHAHEGEIAKLRGELEQLSEALRIAEAQAEASPAKELERALAHLATAEDRARLAENKVEVLKEALEITRARAGNDSGMPHPPNGDRRFREAKRAFARMFHPDHGGRDDDAKERAFLQFWPVLERIDRE